MPELPEISNIREEQQIVTARTDLEVTQRLQQNRIEDLNKLLENRDYLHKLNICLTYFFHIFQSVGIMASTITTGLQLSDYIYIGIFMNLIASIIEAIRSYNNKIANKQLKDIELIRTGQYVDEGELEQAPERQKSDQNKQYVQDQSILQKQKQLEKLVQYVYDKEVQRQKQHDISANSNIHQTQPAHDNETSSINTQLKKIEQAIGDHQRQESNESIKEP